ncbi:Sodium/hydrogen exchanger family-domain-containing protein [Russula earlei]|uniref:Sodium/hydrogen exchanger family-domain-containing protein n=1 Tax=Russula earlei TaxID=71964 RepID=A0ACC0UCX1_9AGAM|nr:Sodium/hydrogen exchanger family-domain-containing protein [Russula earlei]
MHFHPLDASTPHILYACLGGFVVFFGMFSLFIREKLYIGEACWAFLFGVIIGPYGANIFDPHSWGNSTAESANHITLEFTRIVIAIGVFAVGVELPKKYMYRHWKSLFFLLVPVMAWGWFVSAAFIYALIPNLHFLSSLAIAACLTPTDPILAAAVIGGKYADKHVPAHLRHLLAAESASNDGAAYPFLYFALYLTVDRTTGEAMKDWFLTLWLYQIVLSVIWGSALGYGFRHLMKFCERKDLIDRQSYVAQYVSLALLTVGTTTLFGSDDLLASFACGTTFAWDGFFNKQTEASVFSSVIDLLLNTAAFVYVGAWMPFDSFSDGSLSLSVGRLISIAVLILLLRRLPIMVALFKWIPDIKSFREALFSGHFGPIGIGAIFTSTLATESLPRPQNPPANQAERLASIIQPVVAFMVLCSILIHGLSIPFFSLGRRVTTVTRTWSRQPSLPDWALHTRRVERAEDVVINRDPMSVTEHGQAGDAAKDDLTSKLSEPVWPEDDEKRDRALPKEGHPDTDALGVAVAEPEEAKPDNVPDGTEVYSEWREGPHRIIEQRTGPGEEIWVEVQRNAYGPSEAERITRVFRRGGQAAVHRAADEFIGGVMQHVQHDVESGVKGTFGLHGDDSRGSPHQHTSPRHSHLYGEVPVVYAPESAQIGLDPSAEPENVGIRQDEEGWVSDQSSPDVVVEVGHRQTAVRHPNNRASKKRRIDRRSSTRSHHRSRQPTSTPTETLTSTGSSTAPVAGPSTVNPDMPSSPVSGPSSSPTDIADEEPRGRMPATSAPSTLAGHRQPRHMRIVSLRGAETASREVSPARSVRWADAGVGHSPMTARWPQSASAQGSRTGSRAPSPGPPTPGEPTEHALA